MKSIIIIALIGIIALIIVGGGLSSFLTDIGEGAKIVEENEIFQAIMNQGTQIVMDTLENTESSTINTENDVGREQMVIALRIQELTAKKTAITASEYKELETLIETFERNWGS